MGVLDPDSREFQSQELAGGHHTTTLAEGQDDPIHLLTPHESLDFVYSTDNSRVHQRFSDVFSTLVQKTEDFKVQLGMRQNFSNQTNAAGPGAGDHDAVHWPEEFAGLDRQ